MGALNARESLVFCLFKSGVFGEPFLEIWDAGSLRAPLPAVRPELRVVASRGTSIAAKVPNSAHPVGERAAGFQRTGR